MRGARKKYKLAEISAGSTRSRVFPHFIFVKVSFLTFCVRSGTIPSVFCFSQKLGVGGIQDEVYFYHRRRRVRPWQGHLRRKLKPS